jgi:hypothetical protein
MRTRLLPVEEPPPLPDEGGAAESVFADSGEPGPCAGIDDPIDLVRARDEMIGLHGSEYHLLPEAPEPDQAHDGYRVQVKGEDGEWAEAGFVRRGPEPVEEEAS